MSGEKATKKTHPAPWAVETLGGTIRVVDAEGDDVVLVGPASHETRKLALSLAACPSMYDALMEIAHGSPSLAKIDRIARDAMAKCEGKS